MNKQTTTIKNHFGAALQEARALTHVTQETFGGVSSRTYISTLERGLRSPTLQKVDDLSAVMGIHPLTLLTLAYSKNASMEEIRRTCARVENDLKKLEVSEAADV